MKKSKLLSGTFFNRPTLTVTEELLGKFLVRKINGQEIKLMIHEVEAYDGPEDKACHASKGKTDRTKILFGPPGYFYVYFCYGMHWMLNIVVGPKNYPAAILMRGAGEISGPGRLTKLLQIDKSLNNKKAQPQNGLWFEDHGIIVNKESIQKMPRIGVDYAGPVWSKKPYRFIFNQKIL
jgi:DNA-3-methyladenine glycosylase